MRLPRCDGHKQIEMCSDLMALYGQNGEIEAVASPWQ